MKYQITTPTGAPLVYLSGAINENAEATLQELVAQLPVGPVRIDCQTVDYINSIGVMHWLEFLSEARKRQVSLTFERCAPVFYDYAMMLPQFAPDGAIQSLMVPFICESCEEELLVLVEAANLSQQVEQKHACKLCGAEALADVDYYQ